ncbi:MAG TPA: biosynthetic-type acetolactate synthase large subunit [Candidatus Hydrogenedentes bacterium]|nr:biosynthetic-type acetolactate synthase large subunit [Candidatus Hydrogenedentota bacterium]
MKRATSNRHRLAGQEMTGADMILQVLADEGVDTLFGYSGGAILPTYDAIFRYNAAHKSNPIRLIVPANEQGAGFMAAGYARASGKVGAFMVTSGPGATNSVTPIRDSMADSIPVVLMCGQVARPAIGTDAFQEAPVFNLMSACAKHVFLVSNPEQLEATVRTAFSLARSGRPGPVVIDLPKDVQNYVGTFKGSGLLKFKGYEKRLANLQAARVTRAEAQAFLGLLAKSKRPLFYAGGGVIAAGATDALRAFAERYQIPVVNTLLGTGCMDKASPLSLHMLGMHGTAYANYAVMDCDLLIAVGARFDDRVAGKVDEFAANAKIAHIDIDAAEIGKVKEADWCHVGDAKQALIDLLAAGEALELDFSPWAKRAAKLKKAHHLDYDRKSTLIQPQYVIECLNDITKGEAIICTGVGQHQMWSAQYCYVNTPRSFITSGSMGTMGFGLPASIGAQLARPDKVVVDIDGDGSMRMNLGELETVTTYDVPVKIVLLNNLGDGMVRQWQRLYFGERFSGTDKSLHKKRFVKAAEADQFKFARRITEKAQVKRSLDQLFNHDGPGFLEVMIDPNANVHPMVGPGLGYKDMLVGDFIKPRPEALAEEHEEKDMTKIPELF